MSDNVVWLKNHVRASSTTKTGRSTSKGQTTSSGHRSENQRITSSYLRAVKVLASSSKRSKNRQSPAANRPSVDMLTERAAAYAEAQAMRFDRNSDSIAEDDSRKIPTPQANSVGKFRLAENSDKSDKSAMPSHEEVRHRLKQAFERPGAEGPITLAKNWDLGRDHIREFLIGKKDSLRYEVLEHLSEHFNIPLNLLIIRRQKKKKQKAA